MMLRIQACGARRCLAEMKKAPDLVAELRQSAVVVISEILRRHDTNYIVLRWIIIYRGSNVSHAQYKDSRRVPLPPGEGGATAPGEGVAGSESCMNTAQS